MSKALNRIKYYLVLLASAFAILAVFPVRSEPESEDDSFPWLTTFEVGDFAETYKSNRFVVKSGRQLRKLPVGLHSLEKDQEDTPVVLIGIHGYGVSGYEWIYPFVTLDSENIHTFFFRWNYLGKNSNAREIMLESIDEIVESRQGPLEKIVLLTHSCGGVMAISAMDELRSDIPFDLHTVASPLNGLGVFTVCKPRIPKLVPENVTVHQWRTTRAKDSVYWIFAKDPQVVSIEPSSAVRLPPYYRDVRLGHTRSLSWVAEQLAGTFSENHETEPIARSDDL